MKRLIKNGDIILDGTAPRYVKEKEAFEMLEELEDIVEELDFDFDITVLAHLVTHGCYVIDKWANDDGEIKITHFIVCEVVRDGFFGRFNRTSDEHWFMFSDYKKTWAIKKGDLK